jgi:hypothetical protein
MSKSQRKKNANAMKRYEARFFFTQHSVATVIIEARNLDEAEEKAANTESCDIDNLDPVDGELSVVSVEQIKEGGARE